MWLKLIWKVGRVIRVKQLTKVIDDSIETVETDLNTWEKRLPSTLRYQDDETSAEARVFSAMLLFAFQYVQADSFHDFPNLCRFCKLILYRKLSTGTDSSVSGLSLASANAVTRTVEELLSEGLLSRIHVHLYVIVPHYFAGR